MAMIPNVLSILSIILSIYIWIRTRKSLAFVPLASNIPSAKAWVVISNDTINAYQEIIPKAEAILLEIESNNKQLIFEIIAATMIAILFIQFIIYIGKIIYLRTVKRNLHNTINCKSTLWLELSDHKNCALIILFHIPACPSNLNIRSICPRATLSFNIIVYMGS